MCKMIRHREKGIGTRDGIKGKTCQRWRIRLKNPLLHRHDELVHDVIFALGRVLAK